MDPAAPFHEYRLEWGDRFVLWQNLEPWVREAFGPGALYPDQLGAFSTPGELAVTLAAEDESGREAIRRELRQNRIDFGEGLGVRPGLAEEHATYQGSLRITDPTVFLLGCTRSGTTLFRSMLTGHSEIQAPPELHLLQFDRLKIRERAIVENRRVWMAYGLIQALQQQMQMTPEQAHHYVTKLTKKDVSIPKVYQLLHATNSKRILVDKSPSYVRSVPWLNRAEQMFERPRYLFLTRHPLGSMNSMVRTFFDPVDLPNPEPLEPVAAERQWQLSNDNAARFLEGIETSRWLQIRYEELVTEPRAQMERVSAFLGVPFEEAMLSPYSGERLLEGIGDPNITTRTRVEPSLATSWKETGEKFPLGPATRVLARRLGY